MKLRLAPKPKNGKLQRARKWAESVQFVHVDIKEALDSNSTTHVLMPELGLKEICHRGLFA